METPAPCVRMSVRRVTAGQGRAVFAQRVTAQWHEQASPVGFLFCGYHRVTLLYTSFPLRVPHLGVWLSKIWPETARCRCVRVEGSKGRMELMCQQNSSRAQTPFPRPANIRTALSWQGPWRSSRASRLCRCRDARNVKDRSIVEHFRSRVKENAARLPFGVCIGAKRPAAKQH